MSQVSFRAAFTVNNPILLEAPPQVLFHLLSSSFIASYLFINYPSLVMRVVLSLSEWSSCNCFSHEESESGTKEPYRNHICIQDELRCRGGREHCPPALYWASLLTRFPVCPSLLLSSIVSLSPPYLLPPPLPFRSMAPFALSFQRVPRSTGARSSVQGIVHLVLVWMS